MENLRYWDKLKRPPSTALRSIQAGRLRGKTDINPQWRMQAMTETFGPVGEGWTYSIDKLWTEPGAEGQICAFALVTVKVVTESGQWSEPVPGIGGSMLIEKESKGLHTSDEAYKMAVTDGLSVAFKAFGVAAEVYMGMLDGSKYAKSEERTQRKPVSEPPPAPPFIPMAEMFKDLEKAQDLEDLAAAYKSIYPSAHHHFSKGELDTLNKKKDELKKKLSHQ